MVEESSDIEMYSETESGDEIVEALDDIIEQLEEKVKYLCIGKDNRRANSEDMKTFIQVSVIMRFSDKYLKKVKSQV